MYYYSPFLRNACVCVYIYIYIYTHTYIVPILSIQLTTWLLYLDIVLGHRFSPSPNHFGRVLKNIKYWKTLKANCKNLKSPAWSVDTTAYKIHALCLKRSVWHSFPWDPSAQCSIISLSQIWFIIGILASQRDME